MGQTWNSYDSVAAIHDRIAVPKVFAQPAKDLVASMDLPKAGRVLDAGAGTGIAALLAKGLAGPGTVAVALDPSLEMLRIARGHGLLCAVAGLVPGLPFADRTFDRVLANFLLAHLTSYETGLLDIVRVLRPGGKLGVTAWANLEDEFRQRWQRLAESFVDKEVLREAVRRALPWEDWFTDPDHLRRAFADAGLRDIEVRHKNYQTQMTIAEFLAIRETSLPARFMRQTLNHTHWEEFTQALSEEFYGAFKDPIEVARDVWIATGTRS